MGEFKNGLVVIAFTQFSGTTTPDKNGKMPVMAQILAGKAPNRNVMSGTVSERAGFEVGKTYLAQVRLNGTDKDFGDDYSWIKIKELSALEVIDAQERLGEAQVFEVKRPAGFESAYERKGNAVEGVRTIRVREGRYTSTVGSAGSQHQTASEVIPGSSAGDAKVKLNLKDTGN